AALDDLLGKALVLRRIHKIEPARENADRATATIERSAMRDRIDTSRQSANDGDPARGESAGHFFGDLAAIHRDASSAYDRHGPLVRGGQLPADIKDRRSVIDLTQLLGIRVVVPRQGLYLMLIQTLQLVFGAHSVASADTRRDRRRIETG